MVCQIAFSCFSCLYIFSCLAMYKVFSGFRDTLFLFYLIYGVFKSILLVDLLLFISLIIWSACFVVTEDESHMRERKNSFVGTAQYVSPELLTDKSASYSSDLWALGCIIYQMISGLPPFRSR